jgi:hypothetical protein
VNPLDVALTERFILTPRQPWGDDWLALGPLRSALSLARFTAVQAGLG